MNKTYNKKWTIKRDIYICGRKITAFHYIQSNVFNMLSILN